MKPLVLSKAQERFQKKSLKYAPSSTPEGCRSTSPESPFKIPPARKACQPRQPLNIAGAASKMASMEPQERPQVRINPLYFPSEPSEAPTDHVFDVPITISSTRTSPTKSRFRVRH